MQSILRAPDMVLRDLARQLPGSQVRNGPSGFPILFFRNSRVLWKPHRGWFEVYTGHRDTGTGVPTVCRDDASLMLYLDGLTPKATSPICPYCGNESILQDRSAIDSSAPAGRKIYACRQFPACDSYVGAAPGSDEPLGTLANKALRNLRRSVHSAIDPLWQGKVEVSRTTVYAAISKVLGVADFHVGLADESMCRGVLAQMGEIELRVLSKVSAWSGRPRVLHAQSSLPLF